VVHGILAAHHGIVVYSEPGTGSALQIYFPAVIYAAAPTIVDERDAPAGRGQHILFLDDEGVLVFVGTMMLEQSGYKVTGQSGPPQPWRNRSRWHAFTAREIKELLVVIPSEARDLFLFKGSDL
jgi:hypothetical protein